MPDDHPALQGLEELLTAARALADDLPDGVSGRDTADGDLVGPAETRLRRSVIGPLERASTGGGQAAGERAGPQRTSRSFDALALHERLWELARQATIMRMSPNPSNEVLEATAALQDLASRFAFAGLRRHAREESLGPGCIGRRSRSPASRDDALRRSVVSREGRSIQAVDRVGNACVGVRHDRA
jgi:hypothetical protein